VRADAADRIFAAPPPEALAPRVSIPRIFALGLVQPFAHLHRVILAGLIPAVAIAGFCLSPVGQEALDWARYFSSLYFQSSPYTQGDIVAPDPMPSASPVAVGWACLALFVAMTLWLCAWQRGAARGFREPIGAWLVRSLGRLPGYAVALIVWQITPFIVTLPASFVIGWALQRSTLMAKYGIPNGLGLSAEMLTPVQLWVAGIGALTFALLGLWLSARLCPLPAVVAGQGWRGAFGKTWRASSGHGFGLSVSLFAYALIGLLLSFIVSTIGLFVLSPLDSATDTSAIAVLSLKITAIATFAVTMFVLFWHTGIAALLVRESGSLDDPLDLATFD
jgi:hypothetical protein